MQAEEAFPDLSLLDGVDLGSVGCERRPGARTIRRGHKLCKRRVAQERANPSASPSFPIQRAASYFVSTEPCACAIVDRVGGAAAAAEEAARWQEAQSAARPWPPVNGAEELVQGRRSEAWRDGDDDVARGGRPVAAKPAQARHGAAAAGVGAASRRGKEKGTSKPEKQPPAPRPGPRPRRSASGQVIPGSASCSFPSASPKAAQRPSCHLSPRLPARPQCSFPWSLRLLPALGPFQPAPHHKESAGPRETPPCSPASREGPSPSPPSPPSRHPCPASLPAELLKGALLPAEPEDPHPKPSPAQPPGQMCRPQRPLPEKSWAAVCCRAPSPLFFNSDKRREELPSAFSCCALLPRRRQLLASSELCWGY